MGVLDDILPADKSDAAPITQHLRGLLQELRRAGSDLPRITITLDDDAWSALELQFRRPGRPHSSFKVIPLDCGVVAFERKREPEQPRPSSLCSRGCGELADLCDGDCTEAEPNVFDPWQMPRPRGDGMGFGQDAEGRDIWPAPSAPGGVGRGPPPPSPRPADAIYSAPISSDDAATYGGPWREKKS